VAFWGVVWWGVFRRSGLNLVENIVAAVYFTAQTFIYTLLLRLILAPFIIGRPDISGTVLVATDIGIYLTYSFFFTYRLFRETGLRLILKQLALIIAFLMIAFGIAVVVSRVNIPQ